MARFISHALGTVEKVCFVARVGISICFCAWILSAMIIRFDNMNLRIGAGRYGCKSWGTDFIKV